jgi:hypothetical protein
MNKTLRMLQIGAVLAMLLLGITLWAPGDRPVFAEEDGLVPYKWTRQLPADACPGTSDTNCHWGSPALADINGDGFNDVVAVTNKGHVVVVKHNGQLLWDVDIAAYFGMAPGTQEIHSSPAIADIDNDGYMEIAVGAGTTRGGVCTHGGVIVLNHLGGVEPGWPQLSVDANNDGCRDSVFASPALGDLDNDGDMEVVYAGFDRRIYARHHNGVMLPGFTVDSYHRARFPTWPNLVGGLVDTIWGSPVLADINNDGFLDILVGTDEGNFDASWGGNSGGWTCPFLPGPGDSSSYCGGSLYAVNRFGDILPGFPIYIHETIQSTPAVADINGDGLVEIFFGTGNYYYANSPSHPTLGFRLFGINGSGQPLPGWEGGKVVGGTTPSSPVIGDITGDGQAEILVLAMDKKLYAWNLNGQPVSGFPMTPRDQNGNTLGGFNVGSSMALGDYDSDGKMEIFLNQAWVVVVVDGNGQQLTATSYPNDPRPIFFTNGSLVNAPAIGDIDNDGQLELIVSNSMLYAWDLSLSTDEADWAMFKQNPERTGTAGMLPILSADPGNITVLHQSGTSGPAISTLVIRNMGGGSFNWSASALSGVTLMPASGTANAGQIVLVQVTVNTNGYGNGSHFLGSITVTASSDMGVVQNSPSQHPVRLIIGDLSHVFMPLLNR